MDEDLKNKANNELSDDDMKNVTGGWGDDFEIATCPRCSANVWVWITTVRSNGSFWNAKRGTCDKCGYVIER